MRQPDERERFHQLQVSFIISTYFQVPFLFCVFLNFSHLIVCQCRCFLICAYKVLDETPSKLTRKILLCNIYSTITSCSPSGFKQSRLALLALDGEIKRSPIGSGCSRISTCGSHSSLLKTVFSQWFCCTQQLQLYSFCDGKLLSEIGRAHV